MRFYVNLTLWETLLIFFNQINFASFKILVQLFLYFCNNVILIFFTILCKVVVWCINYVIFDDSACLRHVEHKKLIDINFFFQSLILRSYFFRNWQFINFILEIILTSTHFRFFIFLILQCFNFLWSKYSRTTHLYCLKILRFCFIKCFLRKIFYYNKIKNKIPKYFWENS